ncbi:helix-turn-helix domain-containing protein [Nocardia vaccinii]|uniref:helix-turn-helix domain-containing protein n=1 Tax=Nocardia vaccinii TaxID=1822 RepID=UPI00082DB1D4|nr:helix-turn-helix transcriptional regulator [Nocardia vaccinii]
MPNSPQSTKHARRVAHAVQLAGGSDHQAALAVHHQCGLSLLRAHRIARGYTLVEAVELLKDVLASRGTPSAGLSHQRLSQWEHGQDVPTPRYLDALCYLYRTRPDRLGFGNDYSDLEPLSHNGIQDAMDRRHFLGLASASAAAVTAHPAAELFGEEIGSSGARPTTAAQVALLEERTERIGYHLYTAPADFIPARMVDLARIQTCLLTTRSEELRRRLHRLYAKNAGLIAMRLTDVAGAGDAFAWYGIARRAARRAQDDAVQAWIAAWTCDACAGYGRLDLGLAAARAAQSAGAERANSATVLGFLTEAGVQARSGRHRETLEAVRKADRMFDRLPEKATAADGFHASEYLLRWHQANALALVGAHEHATPLRERVLELPVARHDRVGLALLQLDGAAAGLDAGQAEQCCHTIGSIWSRLPDDLRFGLVHERIVELLDALESRRIAIPEAAEVRQLLEVSSTEHRTLPASARHH